MLEFRANKSYPLHITKLKVEKSKSFQVNKSQRIKESVRFDKLAPLGTRIRTLYYVISKRQERYTEQTIALDWILVDPVDFTLTC